jgi:outer membrane lipoprotein-sorting protein
VLGLRVAVGASLLAGCAGTPAPVFSAAEQSDIDRIAAYLNGIPRFEAHFAQSGSFGTGYGLVWLDRPGHLRIDYAGPGARLMVIADGRVRILDRASGSLTTMPLSRTPLGMLLTPTISFSGPVTVAAFRHDPGRLEIVLRRTDQPGQGSLTLVLTDQPVRLVSVSVTDPYGRTLAMALSDIDPAPVLTAGLFTPPALPGS